jgi:hypothetical protein
LSVLRQKISIASSGVLMRHRIALQSDWERDSQPLRRVMLGS